MSVCAPKAYDTLERDHSCFDRQALVRLATAWNTTHPEQKIRNLARLTKKQIWRAIHDRMLPKCKGKEMEACWVDHLAKSNDPIQKKLRPVAPPEWKDNPYEWLSNFDIEDSMYLYEDDPSFQFKMIGVFPVDFAVNRGFFGQCLYQETCSIDFQKLRKRGYRYAGMVINMDSHDEPGSHWTALFIVLDPKLPSYGAYYYNSVPNEPPKEVDAYMKMLQKKAEEDAPGVPFQLAHNTYRHQYKNTECGMFSIAYLVRWLVLLRKNPKTTFERVVKIKIHDEDVHKLRKMLFRKSHKK